MIFINIDGIEIYLNYKSGVTVYNDKEVNLFLLKMTSQELKLIKN